MRIALVPCGATKLPHAAKAADLYTGALFRKLRAYAERHADRWYILSAKHGLLLPDTVVDPYNHTLNDDPWQVRRMWGERIVRDLAKLHPGSTEFLLLAGGRYREAVGAAMVKDPHWRTVWSASEPIPKGLPIGRQLQWLNRELAIVAPPCPT